MKPISQMMPIHHLGFGIGFLAIILLSLGCEENSPARQQANASNPPYPALSPGGERGMGEGDDSKTKSTPADSDKNKKPAELKKVEVGRNVWLEVQGDKRRVLVQAEVCLREGMLEHLMCRHQTKEHEAVLTADVDARDIHRALLLTNATPGTTVQFKDDGTVIPPTGTRIKITLNYNKKGKDVTVSGRDWVRDLKTKKSLDIDWVFAGSHLVEKPLEKDKPPIYMANGGDVICVSNFGEAMLDLPINSSKNNAELEFEAFTERIPEIGTPVTVILEPVLEKKKTEKK